MPIEFEAFTLAAATGELTDEPAVRRHADCLEFRMDLATSDPIAALDGYDGDLPVIVTHRPTWEGGQADDADRLQTLQDALDHDAVGALDIELATLAQGDGHDLVEAATTQGISVIVSTHDFEETPPRAELDRLLTRAGEVGDVAKLAVTAEDRADTLALLAVTLDHARAGATVSTMAMGAVGRPTRAITPVYGSKLAYGAVDQASATAPGQYDVATLRRLITGLS